MRRPPAGLHDRLLGWYRENRRDLPWRDMPDPYRVLVAEFMLQQTQAARVAPVYERFLERFPTVESLAEAKAAEVIRAWSGMGYNRRAVNLHRAARAIVAEHGGEAPSDEKSLQSLPGVGRYTAAAVACFGFGRAVAVVDTNVRRVLGRVMAGPAPIAMREAWELAEGLPEGAGAAQDWNQGLMDLGASVCTARRPRCRECPLQGLCASAPEFTASGGVRTEAVRVAERPRQPPYAGSSRYYRGRIVETLRSAEGPVPLRELTARVREAPGAERAATVPVAESRIAELIDALARNGLVKTTDRGVSLA